MRKTLLVLLVAMAMVATAMSMRVAFADDGGKPKSFSAAVTLGQTSPGTFVPGPGTLANIQGEVFQGTIGSCTGDKTSCKRLDGAALEVVQNANLFFAGPPGPAGIPFAGPVQGTFTIKRTFGKSQHLLNGTYQGTVSGLLAPLPSPPYPPGAFSIGGANNSSWQVVSASGRFELLEEATGTATLALSGLFPGAEVITGLLAGTYGGDEDED